MARSAYKKPFLWALVIHLSLLGILGLSFTQETEAYSTIATTKVVHATFITHQTSKREAKKAKKTYRKKVTKKKKKTIKITKTKKAIKQIKINKKKALAKKRKEQARQKYLAKLKKEKAEKILAAAQAKKIQTEVDQYKSKILASIASQWLVPSSANKNMSCQLAVQLSPSGDVLSVQLIKSSHNVQLDRSAISAVYKSSPLPVPQNAKAFTPFKRLVITMKPENLIG